MGGPVTDSTTICTSDSATRVELHHSPVNLQLSDQNGCPHECVVLQAAKIAEDPRRMFVFGSIQLNDKVRPTLGWVGGGGG